MKRLTARNELGEAYYPECLEQCDGCGSSSKCDKCKFNHTVCEELARYEDTREELDTECEICGLSELIQKVEDMYTVVSRFDISNSGILMKKYRKIVLCEECEYMAENEHGRFCRMADGMTRWLEEGDGCSCGRKRE